MDDSASRRKNAWSREQDETILTMREQQFPWKIISERTGRTIEGCCARYRALLPVDQRKTYRTSKRWSDEDILTLERLMSERKTMPQIVAEMNMPRKVIYSKMEYMRRPSRMVFTDLSTRVLVPLSRLQERDRRMNADRTITAELFGDPRPGQSALDRREQIA